MFFLDFWKINQNISKIFPLLKIFGNKNGIFRGNPENLSKRWVFFLSFTNLSKVDPRGWVFSLSFLLEFCPWVLVFSAVDVKKKAWFKQSNSPSSFAPTFSSFPWVSLTMTQLTWGMTPTSNSLPLPPLDPQPLPGGIYTIPITPTTRRTRITTTSCWTSWPSTTTNTWPTSCHSPSCLHRPWRLPWKGAVIQKINCSSFFEQTNLLTIQINYYHRTSSVSKAL